MARHCLSQHDNKRISTLVIQCIRSPIHGSCEHAGDSVASNFNTSGDENDLDEYEPKLVFGCRCAR